MLVTTTVVYISVVAIVDDMNNFLKRLKELSLKSFESNAGGA